MVFISNTPKIQGQEKSEKIKKIKNEKMSYQADAKPNKTRVPALTVKTK